MAVEPLAAASVLPMAETTTGKKGEWRRARRGSVPELAGRGGFHKHHLVVIFLVINGGEYIMLHESS